MLSNSDFGKARASKVARPSWSGLRRQAVPALLSKHRNRMVWFGASGNSPLPRARQTRMVWLPWPPLPRRHGAFAKIRIAATRCKMLTKCGAKNTMPFCVFRGDDLRGPRVSGRRKTMVWAAMRTGLFRFFDNRTGAFRFERVFFQGKLSIREAATFRLPAGEPPCGEFDGVRQAAEVSKTRLFKIGEDFQC